MTYRNNLGQARLGWRNNVNPNLQELMLDTYNNTTAAYSLRKLNSNYNGPAIRVIRSIDNLEQDIYFLNNELDVNSLSTFCFGFNGYITKWYDQSGNNYHAEQIVLNGQPQIYDSINGIITTNGKYAIKFNGQELTGTQFLINPIPNFTSTLSVFGVSKITNTGQNVYFGNYNDSSYGTGLGIVNGAVRIQNINNTNRSYAGQIFTTNFALETFIRDISNNWTWYEQSVSKGTKSIGGEMNLRSIGARAGSSVRIYSDAYLCELLYYSSDESLNRNAIETNINNYYTIY